MPQFIYIWAALATVALGFITVIWSTDGWINITLKMVYGALTIVGAFFVCAHWFL